MPLLVLAGGAAVDYGYHYSRSQNFHNAVDMATLAAAKEVQIANTDTAQVEAVVRNMLKVNLSQNTDDITLEIKISDNPLSLSVTANQKFDYFFLSRLGKANLTATAVARIIGGSPICVLGLEDNAKGAISLESNAKITGNACAIYSNSKKNNSLELKGGALMKAQFICTAGGKVGGKGNFEPQPLTDCPQISDPLEDRPAPIIGDCDYNDIQIGVDEDFTVDEKYIKKAIKTETKDEKKPAKNKNSSSSADFDPSDAVLEPGVYCGGLIIGGAANVTFEPGVYIIKDGSFYVGDFATIEGKYVGFYFNGKNSNLYFGPNTTISLSAPKDGPMAGLLLFEDRDAPKLQPYGILSDNARVLEGTLYLPQSQLIIDADSPVADQSAYTAIIARQITLYAGPNLVLNSNYELTDVPVPVGIANNQTIILVK